MAYRHIEVTVSGHVGTVWLNRPEKLNALSEDMWSGIPTAVKELNSDSEVRVIVLAGRGKSFTVGIDLEMLGDLNQEAPSPAVANQNLYLTIKRLQQTASAFAESAKPTVAAVQGYCLGAGMDLITACDIRVAAADAIFSIRETRMGLVADVGTLQRLPHIVGSGHVAELAYTGKDFDVRRAAQIGLVNQTADDHASLVDLADQIANEIAENSPFVVAGIKQVLGANHGRSIAEGLDYVARWNSAHLMTNDLMEATTAFMEKRAPEFKGD